MRKGGDNHNHNNVYSRSPSSSGYFPSMIPPRTASSSPQSTTSSSSDLQYHQPFVSNEDVAQSSSSFYRHPQQEVGSSTRSHRASFISIPARVASAGKTRMPSNQQLQQQQHLAQPKVLTSGNGLKMRSQSDHVWTPGSYSADSNIVSSPVNQTDETGFSGIKRGNTNNSGSSSSTSQHPSTIKMVIDELLNEGSLAFLDGSIAFSEATDKWLKAKEFASQDEDHIRKAKCLSNLGCIYRRLGFLDNNLHLQKLAWEATESHLNRSDKCSTDPWSQLIIRVLQLDSVIMSSSVSRLSLSTTGAAPPPVPAKPGAPDRSTLHQETGYGPPILVWMLELATNYANAFFSVGRVKDAITFYEICRKLADAALEEFPLPEGLDLNGESTSEENDQPKFFRLSFVHRKILFSKSISLSHLGSCFSHLGKSSVALKYQASAFHLLDRVWRQVPSLFGQTLAKFRRSSSISSSTMGGQDVPHLLSKLAYNVSTAYYECNLLGQSSKWLKISRELLLGGQWSDSSSRPTEILANPTTTIVQERKIYSRMGGLYVESARLLHASGYRPQPLNMKSTAHDSAEQSTHFPEEAPPAFTTQPSQRSCSEQVLDRGLGFLHVGGEFPVNSFDFQELTNILKDLSHAYIQSAKPVIALYYYSKLLMLSQSPQLDYTLSSGLAITNRTFQTGSKLYLLLLFCQLYSKLIPYRTRLLSHPLLKESFGLVKNFFHESFNIDTSRVDLCSLTPETSLSIMGLARDQVSLLLSYRQQPWVAELLTTHIPMIHSQLEFEAVDASEDLGLDSCRRLVLSINLLIAREASRLALETTSCDSFARLYWLSVAKDALVEGIMKDYGHALTRGNDRLLAEAQIEKGPAVFLLNALGDHLELATNENGKLNNKALVQGYLSPDTFAFIADWLEYFEDMSSYTQVQSQMARFMQLDGPVSIVQEALRSASDTLTRVSFGACFECFQVLLSQRVDENGQARQAGSEGRYEWSMVLSPDTCHGSENRTIIPCSHGRIKANHVAESIAQS